MEIRTNNKILNISKIYFFKNGHISAELGSYNDINFLSENMFGEIIKNHSQIKEFNLTKELKRALKINLNRKDNFYIINKENLSKIYICYDLYIYIDDKDIILKELDPTKKEITEGTFYHYKNFEIILNNNNNIIVRDLIKTFHKKDDNIKNIKGYELEQLTTIESAIDHNENLQKKYSKINRKKTNEFLKQKIKEGYYYTSLKNINKTITTFKFEEFIKVEYTPEKIALDNFIKEFKEKMNIYSYMNIDEFKRFLKFYNIDYNKKFMNK